MRKSWLIIVPAVIWVLNACESGDKLADVKKEPPASSPVPAKTYHRPYQQPARGDAYERSVQSWQNSRMVPEYGWSRPSKPGLSQNNLSTYVAPELGEIPIGRYRFRPLEQETKQVQRPVQRTYAGSAYLPGYQRTPTPDHDYTGNYSGIYEAPQWGNLERQFRPRERSGADSRRRWTGNYTAPPQAYPSQRYPDESYGQWTAPPTYYGHPANARGRSNPRVNNFLRYPGLRDSQVYTAR